MARSRRWDFALVAGAAALALVPGVAPQAHAVPAPAVAPEGRASRLAALQAEIASLYQQAEAATAQYDTATQAVVQQQEQILALARAIVAQQAQVDQLTSLVGQIAADQYTGRPWPATRPCSSCSRGTRRRTSPNCRAPPRR